MLSQQAFIDGNLFPVSFHKVEECVKKKTTAADLFKRLFDIFSVLVINLTAGKIYVLIALQRRLGFHSYAKSLISGV